MITAHFNGKDVPLVTVLRALSAQEGNDGDEGNAMQEAADEIERLRSDLDSYITAANEYVNEIERLRGLLGEVSKWGGPIHTTGLCADCDPLMDRIREALK